MDRKVLEHYALAKLGDCYWERALAITAVALRNFLAESKIEFQLGETVYFSVNMYKCHF